MKLGIRAKLVLVSLVVTGPVFGLVYADLRRRLVTELAEGGAGTAVSALDSAALVAAVLVLAIIFVLSGVAVGLASRQVRALAVAARKMADGDLGSLATVRSEDEFGEFGELGAALDHLARSYAAVLADHRTERERVQGILTGMKEGVLLLDRRRRVSLVNPALREMLLLGAEVEGKSPLEVIRHGELVRLLDEADAEAEPASGEIDLGGLKPRRLLVHVVRIPGDTGGLLAVFVDVTHLRRLETLRRDFVANASHELRTPVAAISSATETLESAITKDPTAALDFLAIIARNAERLRNLVDDLLDLSRIESQDFEVHLEPIDLAEIGGPVLDLFRERAAKKGIRLVGTGAGGVTLLADRRGLEHVLTNLVDNAVKYCGPGSSVTLRAETTDAGGVRIIVEDDGPGIERHHLPRLFERFYRVDPGRSRQLGGTGLGLSIVKHLVEAMGGRIEVDSEPGKGTRFSISLSAAEAEPLPVRMTGAPPPVV
ncbi:MAG TPA: ATP-binding protein [Polyangiaceae bacterium]|nr:ATP-binding protein [Polyangiaceae bacterium]